MARPRAHEAPKTRAYEVAWWAMRVYVLLFAGFIAAFGAFRWRLPAWRRAYEQIGRGDVHRPSDASATDPSYGASYRPDVPIATSDPIRNIGVAIALVAVMLAIWLAIVIFS
jgi:hypothetical protein